MQEDYVFEIIDNSGRKIHLSKKQWTHIRKKHPEIENLEILESGIKNFDKITCNDFDSSVHYFKNTLKI